MLTIGLSLAAALAFALSDLFSQRLTRSGVSILVALVWIVGTGAVICVPAWLLIGAGVGLDKAWPTLGYVVGAGVLYLISYASLLRGLRSGNLSLVTPLASLQGAVAAAIVVVLGEPIAVLTAAGLVLAVTASLLAATGLRGPQDERGSAGAGWALLTALAFGVSLVLYSRATAISPVGAVALSRLATLGLALPMVLRRGLVLPPLLRGNAIGVGLLEALGFLTLVWALARGPAAVASVLSAPATFAVILGVFALKERPGARQLSGVLCAIVAVTLLGLRA